MRSVFLLGGFFFLELGLAASRETGKLFLIALDESLVDEEVVDRVGCLGAFAQPVLNAFLVEINRGWIGQWVVGAENLEGFAPWITSFFGNDKAVGRLFLLADSS